MKLSHVINFMFSLNHLFLTDIADQAITNTKEYFYVNPASVAIVYQVTLCNSQYQTVEFVDLRSPFKIKIVKERLEHLC